MTSHLSTLTGQLLSVDHVVQRGKSRFTFNKIDPARTADYLSKYPDATAVVDQTQAIVMPASMRDEAVRAQAVAFAREKKNNTLVDVIQRVSNRNLVNLSSLARGTQVNLGRGVSVVLNGTVRSTNSFRGMDPRKIMGLVDALPHLNGGSITGIGIVTIDNPIGLTPDFVYPLPKTSAIFNSSAAPEPKNVINTTGKAELAEQLAQQSVEIAAAAQQRAARAPISRAVRAGAGRVGRPRMAAVEAIAIGKAAKKSALAAAVDADARLGVGSVFQQAVRNSSVSSTSSRRSVSRVSSAPRSQRSQSRARNLSVGPLASPQRVAALDSKSRGGSLAGDRSPGRAGSPASSFGGVATAARGQGRARAARQRQNRQ